MPAQPAYEQQIVAAQSAAVGWLPAGSD